MNVFIVDDDPSYVEILLLQIAQCGDHVVEVFHSARDALSALGQGRHCGLLLTDIFMQDMDGLELIMKLGDSSYQGAVAIVSGVSRETLQIAETIATHSGLNLVGSHFKPITIKALGECVRAADAP